jgi:hypothetical protein
MATKRTIYFLSLIAVCLMGIAPLWWFSTSQIVNTEDLRLPPNLAGWFQYFYMWNAQIGTGSAAVLDQSLILFQGIQAGFRWLGLQMWTAQMLSFTFWHLFAGLSMFSLTRKLFPHAIPLGVPLVAASFYMFNPWLDHVWLGFKPPLVAGLAVFPLFIRYMIEGFENKNNNSLSFWGKLFLICIFFAPIGNNISEAFVIALPIVILFGFLLFWGIKEKSIAPTCHFLLKVIVLILVVNAYWIIPESIAALKLAGNFDPSQSNLISWLQGTSKYTSFSNVVRLQGDWTWYEAVGEPYRTYSAVYKNSSLFVILSWILPVLVVGGCLLGHFRYKRYFVVLISIGLFLGMGIHPPTGDIYEWMFNNVPFFWIVRSPYFKFMFMTCIGYAIFLAALFAWLERKLSKHHYLFCTVAVLLVGFNLVYAFPVTTGQMFPGQSERKHLPPQKIAIPPYVAKAGKWLDQQAQAQRVFALNEDRFWTTDWGYRGFSPLLSHFTGKSIIYNYVPERILYTQGAPNQSLFLSRLVHDGINRNSFQNVYPLLRLLGADKILLDKSLRYYSPDESYQVMQDRLKNQANVNFESQFGNYVFYSIAPPMPLVYTTPLVSIINGPEEAIGPITQGDWPSPAAFLVSGQDENKEWKTRLGIDNLFATVAYNPSKGEEAASGDGDVVKSVFSDTFVFSTKDLEPVRVQEYKADQQSIGVTVHGGFYPQNPDDDPWLWMKENNPNARHLLIDNSQPSGKLTSFGFRTTSLEADRSLYVYLNGVLKEVLSVKKDSSRDIVVKNLRLKPGENVISFYTPFGGVNRDGKHLSFGFAPDSFQIGDLAFSGSVFLLKDQEMSVTVIPDHYDSGNKRDRKPYVPNLSINSVPVALTEERTDGVLRYTGSDKVRFNAGANHFQFVQGDGINATLFIAPQEKSLINCFSEQPQYKKISPTNYQISLSMPKPGFLIVSDSFHQGWHLESDDNKPLEGIYHFKANGFANGFYFPKPGKYELTLTFSPQRIFIWSLFASCIGILAFFLLTLFFMRRNFKKRQAA